MRMRYISQAVLFFALVVLLGAMPAWACKCGCGTKSCADSASCQQEKGSSCEMAKDKMAKDKSCGCGHSQHSCGGSSSTDKVSLDRLKDLAGYWESKPDNKGKKEAVLYKTTSAGTVVQEILFPGTDHEMVSMYHIEDGNLVMTHYCALGNQPKLRAASELKNGAMDFEYVSGGNMKDSDMHIHSLRMSFLDKNHIKQEWTSQQDGKSGEAKIIEFERKPSSK